jgi:hypothetical protein
MSRQIRITGLVKYAFYAIVKGSISPLLMFAPATSDQLWGLLL